MTQAVAVARHVQRKTEITQPGVIVELNLTNAALVTTFEGFYPAADMQLNYIFNLARDAGASGDVIKVISTEIRKATTDQIKELEDSAIQAEAVIAGQGIKAKPRAPTLLESEAHTPQAFDFVRLFKVADRSLEAVRMLWVASILSDDERTANERAIRSHCHTISELIGKNFKRVLSITNARPTAKPALVVAEVKTPVDVAPVKAQVKAQAKAKPKAKTKAKVAVAA